MKRIIVDQNKLISLHRNMNGSRDIFENANHLIFLLDANLAEATRYRPEHLEALMRDMLPYRKRLRLAPAHSEVFEMEKSQRTPVTRKQMHSFHAADILSPAFDDIAAGVATILENFKDPEVQKVTQEQFENQKMLMAKLHETVAGAAVDADKNFGHTKDDSIRGKLRETKFIEDGSVLELCVGLAVQDVLHTVGNEVGDRTAERLSGCVSFHLVYYLTKYIRVCQKMADDWMNSVIQGTGKKLGNEYFDTQGVSFSHYFDEFSTDDTDSVRTQVLLSRALHIFHKYHDRIMETALRRGKPRSLNTK